MQVGSHGAGLINHMFMRKGTSFIEIVPCGFDGEFHDDSFQVPARVQNFQFAFKLTIVSPMLCSRSQAELGDPDGKALPPLPSPHLPFLTLQALLIFSQSDWMMFDATILCCIPQSVL